MSSLRPSCSNGAEIADRYASSKLFTNGVSIPSLRISVATRLRTNSQGNFLVSTSIAGLDVGRLELPRGRRPIPDRETAKGLRSFNNVWALGSCRDCAPSHLAQERLQFGSRSFDLIFRSNQLHLEIASVDLVLNAIAPLKRLALEPHAIDPSTSWDWNCNANSAWLHRFKIQNDVGRALWCPRLRETCGQVRRLTFSMMEVKQGNQIGCQSISCC